MPWYDNRAGERLWYEDAGSGTPVVFVHGWCMSAAVWKYQFEALAGSVRLLAPDLRGHGCSRGVSGNLDFNGFAADLLDLFACLGLSKAVLVGWSMGAQVALQALAGLSGKIAGLVLVSATPCFMRTDDFQYGATGNEVDGMRLKVQRNRERALGGFYSRIFAENELENRTDATAINQLLASITSPDTAAVLAALDALARADMRHLLDTVTVPTLIINGAQDRICLPQASSYLEEHIPGARHLVFKECGHAPFLTQSERFNTEIIRFARSVSE